MVVFAWSEHRTAIRRFSSIELLVERSFKVERSPTFENMAHSYLNMAEAWKLLTVAIREYKYLNGR